MNNTFKNNVSTLAQHTSSSAQQESSVQSSSLTQASTSPLATISFKNYLSAEQIWLSHLGFPNAPDTKPCGSGLKTAEEIKKNAAYLNKIQCEKGMFHTWQELGEINHPAILTLSTPEKFSTYVVLIGLTSDKALVINETQGREIVSLEELGKVWTGEAVYLWHRPPSYTEVLNIGDSSPTIEWVAQQFAKLDNQRDPLADDLLSVALQERIKLFQRGESIPVTGTINDITLMKLNDQLGLDKTLFTQF